MKTYVSTDNRPTVQSIEMKSLRTFSSKSWMVASVSLSSSVGFEGTLDTAANWEYL